ncbi:MAG TPA: TlpA family protein disulfide reductase [Caldithrix abyssi]|uniref:TlpA family protein disulfide reductase n=1 Tax=Caldithrix abyssi TaxID=187145 RepID=A0A7V5UFT5_CALAY|nr:TlpA family protein disulfide reductase [Caldithrix abyssi]
MKRTFLLILLNLMIFTAAFARTNSHPAVVGQEKKIEALTPGTPAPPFSLQSLDGNYIFLRDFTGQKLRKPWLNKTKHVVVLSFFATWCVPCQKEIPQLMKIADMFKDQPVKFFLIDVGEKKSKVQPFIQKKGYTIPVLLDVYQVVSEKYGAHTLPRLVVIDKNGTVQYYHKGFENKPDFIPEMKKLIEGLLKK